MASTNVFQATQSDLPLPDSSPHSFDSSSYFLSLPFSDAFLIDPSGNPIKVQRSYSTLGSSELFLFDISFGSFSFTFACLPSSELLPSSLLRQSLVGLGSRFQKTNRYSISSLTNLAGSSDFDPFDFSDCLDQIDYLIALFLQDLFSSLDLNSSVPFIQIKNFLHEFKYQGQVDSFLNAFYGFYHDLV